MIQEVTKKFESELRKIAKQNENVRKFLLNHERKPVVLANLMHQIKLCEKVERSINFNIHKYNMVIKDVAKMFAKAAIRRAEEQAMSRIEKQRRIDESLRIERAKDLAEDLEKEATSTELISLPGGVCK